MTFCYMLPVECLLQVFRNNQLAYWESTCLGTAFPSRKFPGEIALRAHRSLPRNFLERNLNGILRHITPTALYDPLHIQNTPHNIS